jgi:hypothetical protein
MDRAMVATAIARFFCPRVPVLEATATAPAGIYWNVNKLRPVVGAFPSLSISGAKWVNAAPSGWFYPVRRSLRQAWRSIGIKALGVLCCRFLGKHGSFKWRKYFEIQHGFHLTCGDFFRRCPHSRVTHPTQGRILDLGDCPQPSGTQNKLFGSGHPPPLVFEQCRLDVPVLLQTDSQHNCVFNRLTCSLPQIWRHRMGGITQQTGSALDKTCQRVCIVDVVMKDRPFAGSFDQSLNRFMPTAKQPRQHGLGLPLRDPFSFRRIVHGKPVDPPTVHRNDPKTPASTPGLFHERLAVAVEVDYRPPYGVPCISGAQTTQHLCPNNAPQPVSPNEAVRANRLAVVKTCRDSLAVLFESNTGTTKVKPLRINPLRQQSE